MLDARLLRAYDRLRLRAGLDRGRDPLTGRPTGMLSGREAVAAGWATIGQGTYGRFTVNVGPGDRAHLTIGAYTSIAEGVEFVLGGNHRPDWVSTYPFRVRFDLPGAYDDGHPRPEADMRIGSDVWLGRDAMVAPGVAVGDGAVVGARAIVTRDVRPYAIVVGAPAREIRRRFDDERVEALLRIRWWTWPEPEIRDRVHLLSSGDVDGFIASNATRVTR
jgi:acetyltransferase-like isoleucine patch superfamily enzyme